jgi:hypothetical protein
VFAELFVHERGHGAPPVRGSSTDNILHNFHNVQKGVRLVRPVHGSTDTTSINAGAKSKVKSSVQRGIRAKVLETYPLLEPHIEEIMPKKSQLDLLKL